MAVAEDNLSRSILPIPDPTYTGEPPHAVIFDANAQDAIDVTSTQVLRGLLKELQAQGITVCVAHLHEPVLEHGRKTGLIAAIGEAHIFPTVDLAVRSIEAKA